MSSRENIRLIARAPLPTKSVLVNDNAPYHNLHVDKGPRELRGRQRYRPGCQDMRYITTLQC